MRTRNGRNRKASARVPAAATCRRRTCPGSTRSAQHTTAPAAPLDSDCSAAHSRSRRDSGSTTTRRAQPTPPETHAGACNPCGGAISTNQCPASRMAFSTGSSNEHSPTPTPSAKSSVSAPRGQPPPGSSASSTEKPLDKTGTSAPARWPRQTSGRTRISLSDSESAALMAEYSRKSWTPHRIQQRLAR